MCAGLRPRRGGWQRRFGGESLQPFLRVSNLSCLSPSRAPRECPSGKDRGTLLLSAEGGFAGMELARTCRYSVEILRGVAAALPADETPVPGRHPNSSLRDPGCVRPFSG